jgi:hypothetical protein
LIEIMKTQNIEWSSVTFIQKRELKARLQ